MESLNLGQLVDPRTRFCPFGAVACFPYRFMKGRDSEAETVAEKFFISGQFRNRGWNIFYLRPLPDSQSEPILFISKDEVESLFMDIKDRAGINVGFPDALKHPGFDIDFDLDGVPRPRYLGYFCGTLGIQDLKGRISVEGMPPEEPITLNDRSFPVFRAKMNASILAAQSSHQQKVEKKRKARVEQRQGWCSELKRVQCFLGIRPRITADLINFHNNPNATWEESQEIQKSYEQAAGINLPSLDFNKSAPYQFHLDVVFVCVDIEVFERDSTKLTEIGISTLDTRDLAGKPIGENGVQWTKMMRHRHFRIVEHSHLVNKDFVSGCPDKFQPEFGISEWISVHEVPQVVAACFRSPFSKPGCYQSHPSSPHQVPRFGSGIKPLINEEETEPRNVVFVGHEARSDLGWLRRAGYNAYNLRNLIEAVDTNNLYRAWKHQQDPLKLGYILLELEITGWNLHNAGNDAAYTLQALIGLSVAALDTNRRAPKAVTSDDLEKAGEEAQRRLIQNNEDWLEADEEGGDGGDPVPANRLEFDENMIKAKKMEEKREHKAFKQSQEMSRAKTLSRGKESGEDSKAVAYKGGNGKNQGRGGGKKSGQPLSQRKENRLVILEGDEWGL